MSPLQIPICLFLFIHIILVPYLYYNIILCSGNLIEQFEQYALDIRCIEHKPDGNQRHHQKANVLRKLMLESQVDTDYHNRHKHQALCIG